METNTELICEGHFSKTKASVSESVSGWILKFESWWLLYSLLSLWVFWSVGCTLCPIELSTARAGLAFVFHVDSSFEGSHSLSDLAWQPRCPLETSADMSLCSLPCVRGDVAIGDFTRKSSWSCPSEDANRSSPSGVITGNWESWKWCILTGSLLFKITVVDFVGVC